mgnify:CR=1 FL=1
MKNFLAVLAVVSLLPSTTHLCAQSYPNQAINLVILLAPGDAGDVAGRTMAEELSKLSKVSVATLNKPGGGLTIGTDDGQKQDEQMLTTKNAYNT